MQTPGLDHYQPVWPTAAPAKTSDRRASFAGFLAGRARRHAQRVALVAERDGETERFCYAELAARSQRLAACLHQAGLGRGDRVAILSESCPRWGIGFFAVLSCGAIVLPLDCSASETELRAILEDAAPAAILVSARMAPVGRRLQRGNPLLRHTFCLDRPGRVPGLQSIDDLEAGRPLPDLPLIADAPAVLSYTSGTMGEARGVLTTYANLFSQVNAFHAVLGNDSNTRCVSILPLNHLFELTACFLGVLNRGGSIRYADSLLPQDIVAAMRRQRATCMIVVPLFLNLLVKQIRTEFASLDGWRGAAARFLLTAAPLCPLAVRRLMFRRLHRRFGGHLQYFVSGGAPLAIEVIDYLARLGIPVLQGYGLTEASPVIATNSLRHNRPGSVGKPLPGTEVRIDSQAGSGTGEVLARGPQVMQAYYGQPQLTRATIDEDGWLRTGDIGYLDGDGYLYICGRKKNLIVLGNGKNVQAEELEAVLFEHPDIGEAVVLGYASARGICAGSEEVGAVIVPDSELAAKLSADPIARQAHFEAIVAVRGRQLAAWKRPTRILLRDAPLPRTATRKVKRAELARRLAAEEAWS